MTPPEEIDTRLPDLTGVPLSLLDENSPVLAASIRLLLERLDLQKESFSSFQANL